MKNNSLLEEALEAWDDARSGVIAEVENFPANKIDFRAGEHVRSVGETALHIMEVGLMMVGVLTDPSAQFGGQAYPKLIARFRGPINDVSGKRDILAALRRTHRDGVKALREAGELQLLQSIARFDGQRGTRLAWLQHGIGHEEYHRGQLAIFARLAGLTPALTQLIMGG